MRETSLTNVRFRLTIFQTVRWDKYPRIALLGILGGKNVSLEGEL